MDVPYAELLAVLICVLLSALFSGSETALNALGSARLDRTLDALAATGRRHRFLELWRDRRNEALTVILVGNTVVNILASALGALFAENLFTGTPWAGFALPLAVAALSFVVLTFGEIVPKTFAQNNADRLLPLTRLLYPLALLLKPVTLFFTHVSEGLIRTTGGKVVLEPHPVTGEDIEDHIAKAAEQGNLDEEQERLLSSVFNFADILVKEVMIPRTEIVAIDEDTSFADLCGIVRDEGFSRYPVFHGDPDHVIGVLYARDLIAHLEHTTNGSFDLKRHLRDPYFVPETKSILELLRELQRHRVHMAIVVDEFGGTAGLVTIEDIVEEVFGEIYDETDRLEEGEDLVRQVGQGCWEAEGRVSIRDLEDAIDVEFPEDDSYSTVAGFILHEVGKIPEQGSLVRWNGLSFTVLEADEKRVIRVRIDRVEEPPALDRTGS